MKETIVTADAHPMIDSTGVESTGVETQTVNLDGLVPQLRELTPHLDALKNARFLYNRQPNIQRGSKLQEKRESFIRKLQTILKSLPMRESEFLEAIRIKCPEIDEILGCSMNGAGGQ